MILLSGFQLHNKEIAAPKMKKLTKYKNFDDLKSDTKSAQSTLLKKKKTFSELEAFLALLRQEFSIKKKASTIHVKKSR